MRRCGEDHNETMSAMRSRDRAAIWRRYLWEKGHRMRGLPRISLAIGVLITVLAGCGSTSSVTTPTATIPPTATLIPSATATPRIVKTTFTCPTTVVGSQKVFDDTSMGLRFAFPASWTENTCVRYLGPNGQQSMSIGNLFGVSTILRNGLTIQQWVGPQVDSPNETVTLGALAVSGAIDAVSVTAAPTATADPTKPFDGEPFSQTMALVEGTQYLYEVTWFTALLNITDTGSPYSTSELNQQVVTTFVVP